MDEDPVKDFLRSILTCLQVGAMALCLGIIFLMALDSAPASMCIAP